MSWLYVPVKTAPGMPPPSSADAARVFPVEPASCIRLPRSATWCVASGSARPSSGRTQREIVTIPPLATVAPLDQEVGPHGGAYQFGSGGWSWSVHVCG